jgi:hypothetical protein
VTGVADGLWGRVAPGSGCASGAGRYPQAQAQPGISRPRPCRNREIPDHLPAARRQRKGRTRPVSRVLSWTVIPLGDASLRRSSNLPGDTAGRGIVSLFGLAPGGVCRAGPLPDSRCALTAPFHPCLFPAFLRTPGHRRSALCCTFRRLAPPRRYLAPCPVEPGLSSAFVRMTRLSGRLRRAQCTGMRRASGERPMKQADHGDDNQAAPAPALHAYGSR